MATPYRHKHGFLRLLRTAVVPKTDEGGPVAQYNLTLPTLSVLFAEVARRISEHHAQQHGPHRRADQGEP